MTFHKSLLAATALTLLSVPQAFAVEAQDFVDRLQSLISKQGSSLNIESSAKEGNTITLKAVTITAKGRLPDDGLPIGDLMFSGVSENDAGAYLAESLSLADIERKTPDGRLSISGISFENFELPKPETGTFIFYTAAKLNAIDLIYKGEDVFRLREAVATLDANDARTEISFDTDIDSIWLDLASNVQPPQRIILNKMGYETIEASMDMDGDWNAETGLMRMTDFNIDVPKAGKVSITSAFDGYTMEMVEALGALSNIKDEKRLEAELLKLLNQMNHISFSIKFEDKSLTNKLLDFQAEQQGTDRQSLVQLAKAMMPFAMSGLKMPEFTAVLSGAVGQFLEDPQNIEITATPETPIPLTVLVETADSQPQALINLLNVQVKANQ